MSAAYHWLAPGGVWSSKRTGSLGETDEKLEPTPLFGRATRSNGCRSLAVQSSHTRVGIGARPPTRSQSNPKEIRVNTDKVFVGIDVAKADVEYFIRPVGRAGKVPRTPEGLKRLCELLGRFDVEVVVVEPTGGYERVVLVEMFAAELPVKLVPADRVRNYARSLGRRAKTDALDAATLAQMAETSVEHIRRWSPPPSEVQTARELLHRRAVLVEVIGAERKRASSAPNAFIAKSSERLLRALAKEKARIEKQVDDLLPTAPDLARRAEVIQNVKGVGRIVALTLLTELPELGSLSRSEAAALAGVAPYNADSGKKQGKRFIRGGRARARTALFMAAIVGIRHNPVIKQQYTSLRSRGKDGKVALVACMRKLLVHVNSLLRDHALSSPTAAG